MKKIIIFIGILGLLLIIAYQSKVISKNILAPDDAEDSAYQSMSLFEHQTKPIVVKSIEHRDEYSGDYPFRDAEIDGHDEALLNRRTTHYTVELDEPASLIPRTGISPKTPAPYPLEKQLSE